MFVGNFITVSVLSGYCPFDAGGRIVGAVNQILLADRGHSKKNL